MKFRIVENFDDIVSQIKNNNFMIVPDDIWETIEYEGLDEEFNSGRELFTYTELNIPEDVRENLKKFDDATVERFNEFDIFLKDNFKNLIDFVDYDNGRVYIIKVGR